MKDEAHPREIGKGGFTVDYAKRVLANFYPKMDELMKARIHNLFDGIEERAKPKRKVNQAGRSVVAPGKLPSK